MIVPYQLAEEIHEGIKGSKIIAFNGKHGFFLLEHEQFAKAVSEFLNGVS